MEINADRWLYAVTFSANGEYVLSGVDDGVRVWRVQDGKRMATMEAIGPWCLAVSKDGRWIAAGTFWGCVHVWDANTYKQVSEHKEDWANVDINGVDFSPDSARLVSASNNGTATIWDIATRERVTHSATEGTGRVFAAKYSPQGDRIATATCHSVQLYDSNDGCFLVDIKVEALTGLL